VEPVQGALTDKRILAEPVPTEDKTLLRCQELRGFGASVSAGGVRSYFVEVRIRGGGMRRRVLGKLGSITMLKARSMARELIAQARLGQDIGERRTVTTHVKLALREAYESFREARDLRSTTLRLYGQCMARLESWHGRSLWSITRADVSERYQQMRKQNGETAAGQTMRLLRGIWHHHAAVLEPSPASPTDVLTLQHAWPRNLRRTRMIGAEAFPSWWRSLDLIAEKDSNSPTWAVLFRTLALLGTRLAETLHMEWEWYDARRHVLTIPASRTKNKRELVLPVGPYLAGMLAKHRKTQQPNTRYVFASAAGTLLKHPGNPIQRHRKKHGLQWSPHDLRRLYTTVADSLGVPVVVQKKLLNHSTTSDVTFGYTVPELADLRKHQERIERAILERAKVR
jgi:integrase